MRKKTTVPKKVQEFIAYFKTFDEGIAGAMYEDSDEFFSAYDLEQLSKEDAPLALSIQMLQVAYRDCRDSFRRYGYED